MRSTSIKAKINSIKCSISCRIGRSCFLFGSSAIWGVLYGGALIKDCNSSNITSPNCSMASRSPWNVTSITRHIVFIDHFTTLYYYLSAETRSTPLTSIYLTITSCSFPSTTAEGAVRGRDNTRCFLFTGPMFCSDLTVPASYPAATLIPHFKRTKLTLVEMTH